MSEQFRELDALLQGIRAEMHSNTAAINATRRWKQRVARAALATAIAAVLAFTATGVALWKVHQNTEAIHASQLDACAIANTLRAREVKLWEHAIAASRPPPGQTPAQRRQRQQLTASFLVFVTRTFRPLDCQRLYGK